MVNMRGSLVPAITLDANPVDDRGSSFPEKRLGGPKTVAGKRRSALNALRSGLYADAILIKGEGKDEYLRFARAIVAGLDVQSALEMAMAERVVSALWRSRRARRYEQAHLNRFADEAEERRKTLEDAERELANHVGGRDAIASLAGGERVTADELNAAASAIAEVYWRVTAEDEDDEDLPDRFWELFPERGRPSRKRVAAIAAEVREVFRRVYVAESAYKFWSWITDRMSLRERELAQTRDRAAESYLEAAPRAFILDTTEADAYERERRAGSVLEDAERRLDRQVSRALADLEAARRLRPLIVPNA